jgi:hypothetical protein
MNTNGNYTILANDYKPQRKDVGCLAEYFLLHRLSIAGINKINFQFSII